MPEIKCEYGHVASVGSDEWLSTLTLDQLRYAREKADEKIKKAEESPRRTVWLVSICGWNDGWYREDDYEKAAEHLLRVFRDKFVQAAKDFLDQPYARSQFTEETPRIIPFRCTQHEYETEWFPPAA